MDIGLTGNAGKIQALVILKAREPVAGSASVRINQTGDFVLASEFLDKVLQAKRRFFGKRIGAGDEENLGWSSGQVEVPKLCGLSEIVEPAAQGADVVEKIFANHSHDFPEGLTGFQSGRLGKASQDGHIDGGVELVQHLPLDAQPFCRRMRSPAVEPFGRFQPIAKLPGVVIESEVLKDEGERTNRSMVAGKLMVVEIGAFRFVEVADIEDADPGVGEVPGCRFAPDDRDGLFSEQDAAGKKFVLMSTAGMGENGLDGSHARAWFNTTPQMEKGTFCALEVLVAKKLKMETLCARSHSTTP